MDILEIVKKAGLVQCPKCKLYYKKKTDHCCSSQSRYDKALESLYVEDLEGW